MAGANVCALEVRHWGWEYHTDEYKWDNKYTFAGSWRGEGADAELDELSPGAFVLHDLRAQHRSLSQGELLSHKIRLTYSAATEEAGPAMVTLDAGWGELLPDHPLGASDVLRLTVKDATAAREQTPATEDATAAREHTPNPMKARVGTS